MSDPYPEEVRAMTHTEAMLLKPWWATYVWELCPGLWFAFVDQQHCEEWKKEQRRQS